MRGDKISNTKTALVVNDDALVGLATLAECATVRVKENGYSAADLRTV